LNVNELKASVEAILFAAGEPVLVNRIANALEIDSVYAVQALEDLRADYEEHSAGLCIAKLGDKYQMCTRKEFSENVRKVLEMRRDMPLSQAAFEVLAVVAYNQPVTKSFIEQVRGVDCSGVITLLSQRGLIEERGRLDLPGRPIIYGTTPAFLRCFCIESLDELPALPETEEELEKMEEAEENFDAAEDNFGESEVNSEKFEEVSVEVKEDSMLEL